jgi:hypothetical protein
MEKLRGYSHCFAFSEANFFKKGGKCGMERKGISGEVGHQFVRQSGYQLFVIVSVGGN